MSRQTQGPWYRLSGKEGEVIISNTVLAHWPKEGHYVGQVTANNAALVATAPELLAALELVLGILDETAGPGRDAGRAALYWDDPEVEQLRAIVAKARGE